MKKILTIGTIALSFLSGLFGCKKEVVKDISPNPDGEPEIKTLLDNASKDFPPVPKWMPEIEMPLDLIVDRLKYYTDGKVDFVVFSHSTCVIVSDSLTDAEAKAEAVQTLAKIFNYHPDMNPTNMDDGNILVRYNHPACNVVLAEVTDRYWREIDGKHQSALARDEVLMTSLGPNKFDDFGKKALFGRCYFFMDAKNPVVSRIVRKEDTQ